MAADTALGMRIDTEEAARLAGDAANATAILAEETARMAADAALSTRIDAIEIEAAGNIGDLDMLTTDIKTTIVAAINEVDAHNNATQLALENEVTRAMAAEAAVQAAAFADATAKANAAQSAAQMYADGIVATEATARIAGDATNAAAIAAETTARMAADTALGIRIDEETARAIAEETLLSDRILGEAQKRAIDIAAVRESYDATNYTFQSGVAATTHTITHNLNADFVTFTVLVERPDGSYRNDIVSVEETNSNTLTIFLTVASKVKVAVHSMRLLGALA